MANPNIVNVATITAKMAGAQLTTSYADTLANAASSGKVFKINSITAANTSSSLTLSVHVRYVDASDNTYHLVSDTDIPPNSTLVVLDKNNVLYLEEDTQLSSKASAGSSVDLLVSYEEIS